MVYKSKFKKMERKEIIKRLTPFWKGYWEKEAKFREETVKLEKKMSKKLDLGIELEFFCVNNECVGIGAANIKDRKKFPLIHDSELQKKNNFRRYK